MARREKIEAEVEFKAKGLAALRTKWLDFAGDLIEPVALLAAGATKVEAAWAGVRGMFLTRVLGPLGMVAGAAVGLLATTKKLVAEWSQLGLRGAATLERMTLQFRPLLGSMSLARQRVKELFDFVAKTPWQLGEAAAANKVLENLTKGALSTKDGMMLIGDAAAVAGRGFEQTATYVGRLYDALMNNRAAGEAAMYLQEFGLITGRTRNAIESMQAANVSGAEIWKMVSRELERAKGAMDDMGADLLGLESTMSDVQQQMEAGFGKGFLEGEKASIRATTDAMERFTPVAEYFGEVFGTISNAGKRFKAWLVDSATSLPGFANGMKVAGMGALILTAAIVAASGAMLGRFIAGIISATYASGQLAKSSGSVAAAEVVETAVSRNLTAAKAQLAAAKLAVAEGSTMEAVGSVRAAAASTVAAVRTNALTASQAMLRGALSATGAGLRFVAVQLRTVLVAIVTNPWMLLATALLAVGAALLSAGINARKAREELENYRKATAATAANLEQQRRAVQSVTDLRKLEGDAVRELAEAYRDLETASRAGDKGKTAAARERVALLERERAAAGQVDPSRLRKSESETELEDLLKARAIEARLSREDYGVRGDPEGAAALAKQRRNEAERRAAAATDAMNSETGLDAARAAARAAAEDPAKQARLMQDIAAKEAALDEVKRKFPKALDNGAVDDPLLQRMKEDQEAIDALRRELEELSNAGRIAQAELGMNSESELARLKTAAALYDEWQAALAGVAAAARAAADADEGSRASKQESLRIAEAELEIAQRLVGLSGIQDERARQDAGRRIEEIQKKRGDELDPVRLEEARQAQRDAEAAVAEARLDAEEAVAGLRLRGVDAERSALYYELQRLEIAKQQGRIGEEEYRRQKQINAEKVAALQRQSQESREALENAFAMSRAAREEEAARRSGRTEDAEAWRAERERLADARVRREAEREAREVLAAGGERESYVNARVEEERARREQERARDEEERKMGRERAEANEGTAIAALRARIYTMQGKPLDARKVKSEAQRRQDELDRKEEERRLRDQGFGAEDAKRMSGRGMQIARAQRMYEELSGRRSYVVADSLAAVGGGGGVSGRDSEVDLLKKMVRALELIEKHTKEGGVDLGVD